ncbi:hypothetical protein ACLOJK_034207, partial [Asimina triloba]
MPACESSLGAAVGVGSDPCSGQGSGARFLPPSSVLCGPSLHFPSQKRGDSNLRQRLFRNSPSATIMEPKVGHAPLVAYKSKGGPFSSLSIPDPR